VNEKLILCGPAQANGLTAARLWCVAGRPGSTDRAPDDGPTMLTSMMLTAMTSKSKTVTTAAKTAD
jgi:hypothetical protein